MMLSFDQIRFIAGKSAAAAASVLCLKEIQEKSSFSYSVLIIHDPSAPASQLHGEDRVIELNTAVLTPFPQSLVPLPHDAADVEQESNRQLRLALKVSYLVYREMRHLYQKLAVEIYTTNKLMNWDTYTLPMLESEAVCEAWRREFLEKELTDPFSLEHTDGYPTSGAQEEPEIDKDAEAFAMYFLCRYPLKLELIWPDPRIDSLKEKYDSVPINI